MVVMTGVVISLLLLLMIIIAFLAISKARIPLGKTRLILGSYLVVLFICVPVFYAVAEPGAPEPLPEPEQIEIGPEQYSDYDLQINAFYDALHEGRLHEYEGAEVITEWSFDYQAERLQISFKDYQQYSNIIAVERKGNSDGKLDVLCYAPKAPDGRLRLANPPEIRLQGDELQIIMPEKIHLEEVRFLHDFTMAQFTGKGFAMDRRDHFFTGHTVLYLQIPPDLQIETDESTEHLIQFINE